ncbi:MAG: YneF family protein [Erysipelotrichaceae bacterium]|nr:YneF family protein [Erysipelotrichaceae bacterium]
MEWLTRAGFVLLGLIVGGVAGFFIARWYFKKQLEENPPINEDMIRAMYMSMGRKPSEAQIRQVMQNVNKNKPKGKNK